MQLSLENCDATGKWENALGRVSTRLLRNTIVKIEIRAKPRPLIRTAGDW